MLTEEGEKQLSYIRYLISDEKKGTVACGQLI
jgi:hypothetical protein